MSDVLVSFVLPTLNCASWFEGCIQSILKQDFDQDSVEIIMVDGGSTDGTLEVGRKYGLRLLHNEKVLCEPGVAYAVREARGKYCTIMGADNRLVEPFWLRNIIKPLEEDARIIASFPKLINHPSDTWLTRYVNTFTDPFNHFIYGYASNPTTFEKVYPILQEGVGYKIFKFDIKNHPILAFDQGFTLRRSYERPDSTEFCDILPVIDMIERGWVFAYVYSVSSYHHTLQGGLKQFIRKQRWAIDNGLADKPYGFVSRVKFLNLGRLVRSFFWPFYSVSFILPLIRSVFFFLIDRKIEWLYHPFISFVSGLVLWQEVVRIRILRQDPLRLRQ